MSFTKQKKKPRFIKPPNNLKLKVGKGGIDPALIKQSQEHINNIDFDFIPHAEQFLVEFQDTLDRSDQFLVKFQEDVAEAEKDFSNSKDFEAFKENLASPIMQLKANGGMFHYQLVSDVADIALQFVEATGEWNKDTQQIMRAHVKTLKIIIANQLRGDGGREGHKLVNELHQACTRYFKKHKKN